MRLSARLSVLATVAISGLIPTLTTSAAAALAAHGRAAASGAASAANVRQAPSPASITSGTAPLWAERFHGTAGNTAGFATAVSPTGSTVYVTGSAQRDKQHHVTSGVTLAYDSATGTVLWQTHYDAPPHLNASFNDIVVSPDGSAVYVTGQSGVGTSSRAVAAAYNASSGALIWAQSTPGGNINSKIAVSPDGSKVFATNANNTIAYDATTGAVLWTQAGGVSVKVAPDGSAVYVLEGSSGLTAHNPATGAVLWTQAVSGSVVNALAVSPDGSELFVTGAGARLESYTTEAFDAATGATLWTEAFRRANHVGEASAVAVSPDGSTVFVTGSMFGPTTYTGWGTVAYDATTGAQLWVVRFHKRIQNIDGTAVAASPDGSKVFVTGITSAKSGAGQPGTAAYDAATGALLWIGSYTPLGFSGISRSIAVSPDGSKVFVNGAIWPGVSNVSHNIMVTAAYNS